MRIVNPALPFSHLGETSGFMPRAHGDSFFRRNSGASTDLFGMHQGRMNQLRSRAGSNFDINDCFSKDTEENVCLGTVSIKAASLFKRANL